MCIYMYVYILCRYDICISQYIYILTCININIHFINEYISVTSAKAHLTPAGNACQARTAHR